MTFVNLLCQGLDTFDKGVVCGGLGNPLECDGNTGSISSNRETLNDTLNDRDDVSSWYSELSMNGATERPRDVGEISDVLEQQKATPLIKHIEDLDWNGVLYFLQYGKWTYSFLERFQKRGTSAPGVQARTWWKGYGDNGLLITRSLPIHVAIVNRAPFEVIKALLATYPEALHCADNDGNLPLHLAFRCNIEQKQIMFLLKKYPEAIEISNEIGLRPIECLTFVKDRVVREKGEVVLRYVDCTRIVTMANVRQMKIELQKIGKQIDATAKKLLVVQEDALRLKAGTKRHQEKKELERKYSAEILDLKTQLTTLNTQKEMIKVTEEESEKAINDFMEATSEAKSNEKKEATNEVDASIKESATDSGNGDTAKMRTEGNDEVTPESTSEAQVEPTEETSDARDDVEPKEHTSTSAQKDSLTTKTLQGADEMIEKHFAKFRREIEEDVIENDGCSIATA